MKGVVSAVLVGAAVATHYEKPPCAADEIAGQVASGAELCAPKCDGSGSCPSDIPSGVTAKPQCALKTTGGDNYCALVCQKDTDCGTGGSKCTKPSPAMPTGVCTYASGLTAPTPSNKQDMFEEFGAAFGRFYKSTEEREKRFGIFVENLVHIGKMKIMDSGATYSHTTPFADWSVEEFSARNTLDARLFQNTMSAQADINNASLPDSFDWREKGAVNDVKNQGQCGSCWAFSTVANIEGVNFVKTQKLVSLSEQELVDCDHAGDEGCQGGLPSNAFKYLISSKAGLELESKYPYVGTEGGKTCNAQKADEVVFISSWKQISTDENQMAAALIQYGPLSIGLNAGPMQWYGGGIADPWDLLCNPKSIDHGVAIVGFGSESKPFWIIRNSWGASWGEKGYWRVVRGKGKCGLNSMVTTAVIGDTVVV